MRAMSVKLAQRKITMRRIIIIMAVLVVGGFLLIQLVPYGHNHTNPPVVQEPQ